MILPGQEQLSVAEDQRPTGKTEPGTASVTVSGRKPKLADLFCCAGGAAMGYARAGFEVVGFDIKPQKNYPFEFRQCDVMGLSPRALAEEFRAIHASPPCQKHTELNNDKTAHEDLIPGTRALLIASGLPYIMENVEGAAAEMREPITLCGSMFGLGAEGAELRRHRLFETSWPILFVPQCVHRQPRVIGVYGGHGRDRRRSHNAQDFSMAARRLAMGMDWTNGYELSQAIPPAYTEWLGREMLDHMQARRAA